MGKSKYRFLYMVLAGIIINFILHFVSASGKHQDNQWFNFLFSIVLTILVWEGNLRIDKFLNKRFPWETKTRERIFAYLPITILFSGSLIYFAMLAYNEYICEFSGVDKDKFLTITLVISVLISIILLTVEICIQFFRHWKNSLVEIERYKVENIQAQLQNLKNQISPHFLFNNLSVLSSLVYQDQDKAVEFINQLSKVYRYILDNRDSKLVTLENELEFVSAYTALLKIRFDKNINFKFDVPEALNYHYLPPLAIQMLIENAIKHNEISAEQPLTVSVLGSGETIEVSNNIQLRNNFEPSSKTGLQNIKDRYHFYTDKPVEIIQNFESFRVILPLLKTQ